eukprot:gene31339-7288_t
MWVTSTALGAPAAAQKVCIRALSGEHVGPGEEGPVLFGAAEQSFYLTYCFRLSDAAARGERRIFCFVWARRCPAAVMAHAEFSAAAEVCLRERRLRRGVLRPLDELLGCPTLGRDLHARLSRLVDCAVRGWQVVVTADTAADAAAALRAVASVLPPGTAVTRSVHVGDYQPPYRAALVAMSREELHAAAAREWGDKAEHRRGVAEKPMVVNSRHHDGRGLHADDDRRHRRSLQLP